MCTNTNVCRHDIRPLLQESAGKKGLMSQPRRVLVSSSELTKGTISIPLLLFHLELELVCTKICCFVEYTLVKCFNNIAQSALSARRQEDENPKSDIVAQNMKLFANGSYAYQLMNRNRHSIRRYMNDGKTHAAIYMEMFKRLGLMNDRMYEVELSKSEILYKEPIIVRFFILQYAKLRILEFCYNFFFKTLRY